jgi:Na+/melibiose symporter-like transporter
LIILGGGLFAGMFVATGLEPKMLNRFSKKDLYNASSLIEIAPSLLLFGLYLLSLKVPGGLTNIWLLIPAVLMFTVKGFVLGTINVLQANMVADAVDFEDYTNHLRPDGVFFSGLTFMVKIGNGISSAIYAILCSIVAFSGLNVEMLQDLVKSHVPRDLMQSGSNTVVHHFSKVNVAGQLVTGTLTANQLFWFFTMMFFAITILPAVCNALSVIPTWHYSLSKETYAEVLTELQARRRAERPVEDAE